MIEAYCSFEVAKLLKEKEFNKEYPKGDCTIFACTHQMVLAWLREKGVYIVIRPYNHCKSFKWSVYDEDDDIRMSDYVSFTTYEEATEEAIKYTLTNLI